MVTTSVFNAGVNVHNIVFLGRNGCSQNRFSVLETDIHQNFLLLEIDICKIGIQRVFHATHAPLAQYFNVLLISQPDVLAVFPGYCFAVFGNSI